MAVNFEVGGDEGDRTPDLLNAIFKHAFNYIHML